MSVASRTILSNFSEEQCPQSHPQYLSVLSRALFPTTFLEIAVYSVSKPQKLTRIFLQEGNLKKVKQGDVVASLHKLEVGNQ